MDRPTATELVQAVRLFLGEAADALEGRLAFHARVAANALAIVERQRAGAPETAEAEALARLADGADLPALRRAVGQALGEGRLDPQAPEVLAALADSVLARLAVDNPRYAAFERLGRWRGRG